MDTQMMLERAVNTAAHFLLAARNREGWWLDFSLYPGASDEWMTAYVGTVLASMDEENCTEAARDAWHLLVAGQRLDGRWGYNRRTVGDADSTGWGIHLAYALGLENTPTALQARLVMKEHMRADGGCATYATDGPIRRSLLAPDYLSFRGWCGVHECVTASIAALPDYRTSACACLRARQREDGSWKSYWWCDHEYATALAVEALACEKQAGNSSAIQQAVSWARERLSRTGCVSTSDQPAGSPFATAWCLRILLLAADPGSVADAVQAATGWLLQQQCDDGSWPSSARMRVPLSSDEQPDTYTAWIYGGKGYGSVVFDQHSLFTTATVLATLRQFAISQKGASCHVDLSREGVNG